MSRLPLSACLAVGVFLSACGGEAEPVEEPIITSSICGELYGVETCTWTERQGDVLVAMGADLPLAAIENAPAEVPMAWPPVPDAVIAFPAVEGGQSALTELTVSWEFAGHGPASYATPHFDFHFYLAGGPPRSSITCEDSTKPATLADGYSMIDEQLPPEVAEMLGTDVLVGVCIPEMGMHSMPSSDLDETIPWTGSAILGYYAGAPIFIEPMITRAKLMERQSFGYPIPTIPGQTGSQPRQFNAVYQAEGDMYRFTFSEFSTGA